MLSYTNKANYNFVWPETSDIVEIYHPNTNYSDAPIEAVLVEDLPRSRESLKKLAQASEYKSL